jgi:hypothetical protein
MGLGQSGYSKTWAILSGALFGLGVVLCGAAVTFPPAPPGEVFVPMPEIEPDEPAAEAPRDELATPKPTEWRPKLKRCHRGGRRPFCDGPRLVPVAKGKGRARAERLELGTRQVASRLLVGRPLDEWIEAVRGHAEDSLLWPVDEGRFGRGFGYIRKELKHIRHDGVDIPADPGSQVRAANDAIVAYADNGVRGFGNLVLLVHADGSTTLYAHLKSAYVFAGQQVKRGQIIGEVGSTGLSRGPHLHFEWHVRGRPKNPAPRFVRRSQDSDVAG